jgi:dienelactone hydrolase
MRPTLLLALLVATTAVAPTASAGDAPRTGIYQVSFTERSPESAYERMAARYGSWKPTPDPEEVYRIEDEPFDVNVPADYDGTVAYGLIVHTDAGSTGNPYVYKDLMGPHKLIWIGAAKVPNERRVACRWGLALDAVWNMTRRYRIDPKRIYATGMSGGGRCASMIAPTYADVFTGGALYVVGCNAPQWPDEKKIGKPIHELAIGHRFAFLTGEKDFNRQDTKSVLEAYKGAGFKHVELFDTPGMGHEFAPPEVFGKAIDSVDAPLLAEAEELLATAQALEKKAKLAEAFAAYAQAAADYPLAARVVAEAKPRIEELRIKVDAQLQPEFAKLEASPNAEKMREFAAKWAAFPVAERARADADGLAEKQLEALAAAGGSSAPGKLEKFLVTWNGYPVCEHALARYDRLAAAAYAPIEAMTEAEKQDKALLKFLAAWSACPTVAQARATLENDLALKLGAITALDKPAAKAPKLDAFAKAWKGTAAAAEAERQLAALIAAAKAPAKAPAK